MKLLLQDIWVYICSSVLFS